MVGVWRAHALPRARRRAALAVEELRIQGQAPKKRKKSEAPAVKIATKKAAPSKSKSKRPTPKRKNRTPRQIQRLDRARAQANGAAPVASSRQYASQLISKARKYFADQGRWTPQRLVDKRRRLAIRLLALEEVMMEQGIGVMSAETRAALGALR